MSDAPAGFIATQVTDRIDWAEGLFTIKLAATPEFEAGQFFNLALPKNGEWVRRSYSAASAPGDPLEFYLVEVEGGGLTPALARLHKGDGLALEAKSHGFFTLRYVPDAHTLWCIATGTGLGPFISILRSSEPWQRFERIIVVHGVRSNDQLSYEDELLERSKSPDRKLHYVTAVSREQPRDGGLAGRVTSLFKSGALEGHVAEELNAQHSHVMLCGNPAMVNEMIELLQVRGLRRHRMRRPGHITTESYW